VVVLSFLGQAVLQEFVKKPMPTPKVGITSSQFCQHFTSSFCTDILLPKNNKAKL